MNRTNFKKNDIINNLSYKTGFSKNYSKKIINDLINILISNLAEGDLVLKNIGSFKLKSKKERIGRNPKTKEEFLISSRRTISFIPSKSLTSILNLKYE